MTYITANGVTVAPNPASSSFMSFVLLDDRIHGLCDENQVARLASLDRAVLSPFQDGNDYTRSIGVFAWLIGMPEADHMFIMAKLMPFMNSEKGTFNFA
jgi:hypothetical protein